MKKRSVIILSVILAVLIIGGAVGWSFLPHALNYDINGIENIGSTLTLVSETADRVTVKMTEDRAVKIMFFTDTHLDGKNKTSKVTVNKAVNGIIKEKPDLVIFGGDNVTSGLNKKRSRQFSQIFENLGVYWGGILGNHEGDNGMSVTRPEMVGIFSSFEHCLMQAGPEDIWGDCNYCIDILNSDGTLCQTLYFFDTGDEVSEETKARYGIPMDESPYDGVKTSQVEWYKNALAETKKLYGENARSVAVTHIPLAQYQTAFDEGAELLYGAKRENICESGFDSGLFDAIKTGGSTTAVFCGHDHINDFGLMYDGILLSYLQPSGYGSYTAESRLGYEEKDWLQGYTLLNVEKDGTFTQTRHRYSEDIVLM